MPNIKAAKILLLTPVVLYLLVFAGCGKPSHRQDRSEDLTRQTDERILHQARADYQEGRDAKVIDDLNRFLSVHSNSPKETEARWLLAQSYQRSGSYRAALKQYTILSQKIPPGEKQKEVQKRITELEQHLKEIGSEPAAIKSVRVSLARISEITQDPGILEKLSEEGVTNVVIDFGCSEKVLSPPQTAVKTSGGASQGQMTSSIAQIHRSGLRAFAGINLRCLGYFNSQADKQWLDGSYDSVTRKVHLSPYYDLFHPQYQKLMAYEIKMLAASGIHGIVFLAGAPLGMYDGFTRDSVDQFNKTFQTRMTPQTLFQNGKSQGKSGSYSNGEQDPTLSALETSDFWRWTGWKTRQRLLVMQDLMNQIHETKPDFAFGLELHPESIQDPLGALTQYSEDFLEANRNSFSFFLVTPKPAQKIQSDPHPPLANDLQDFIDQSRTLVDRMMLVLKNPARIWLSIPWGKRPPTIMVSDSPRTRHLEKVSQIYDLKTFLDK